MLFYISYFFFLKQKTAYEVRISDWSSDVCSSDLDVHDRGLGRVDVLQRGSNLLAAELEARNQRTGRRPSLGDGIDGRIDGRHGLGRSGGGINCKRARRDNQTQRGRGKSVRGCGQSRKGNGDRVADIGTDKIVGTRRGTIQQRLAVETRRRGHVGNFTAQLLELGIDEATLRVGRHARQRLSGQGLHALQHVADASQAAVGHLHHRGTLGGVDPRLGQCRHVGFQTGADGEAGGVVGRLHDARAGGQLAHRSGGHRGIIVQVAKRGVRRRIRSNNRHIFNSSTSWYQKSVV